MDKTTALGIMSGSSIDGLDICLVEFSKKSDKWTYKFLEVRTIDLTAELKKKLSISHILDQREADQLDIVYGEWIATKIKELTPYASVIAVHGHTVDHCPEKGISNQIGNPAVISKITGLQTVANFRNLDISLGGQGAPLVPMGEKLLFSEFDGFLNLGGICNATFRVGSEMVAGDIGPFNQVFNFYARIMGYPYDDGGRLSQKGTSSLELIADWSSIPFFRETFPKSIGNNWVRKNFLKHSNPELALASFSEFISSEIATVINRYLPTQVMVTGGGVYNDFLIRCLQKKCDSQIVIPDKNLIEFKEALIFALLGLLRIRDEKNVLSSCTGAKEDSCSGEIFYPT